MRDTRRRGRAVTGERSEAGAARTGASLRLFLALDPPAAVRDALASVAEDVRTAAGSAARALRFLAPDTLHLTVQFLGAVPAQRAQEVAAAAEEAARRSRPFTLTLCGAGAFPSPSRARVLWAGLDGEVEPLRALAAEAGACLAPLGFPPESRPLSPHVTVARAREPRGARALGPALERAARAVDRVDWCVDALVLFRSELGRGGARYTALGRYALGPRPLRSPTSASGRPGPA